MQLDPVQDMHYSIGVINIASVSEHLHGVEGTVIFFLPPTATAILGRLCAVRNCASVSSAIQQFKTTSTVFLHMLSPQRRSNGVAAELCPQFLNLHVECTRIWLIGTSGQSSTCFAVRPPTTKNTVMELRSKWIWPHQGCAVGNCWQFWSSLELMGSIQPGEFDGREIKSTRVLVFRCILKNPRW